ncbi:MAG: HIT family protein [Blastomonas fulva]|uniref:HIT family protein n=1 Tax=Blastomonas fulva TaxID=1550728 RepID=UPI00403494E5
MTNSTRFAWIFDESIPRSSAACDQEILRTDHLVAVPSAGALVAGWTLLVPRRPMLNLTAATAKEKRAIELAARQIGEQLEQTGEQIWFFEHGSRNAGGVMGCGVDQAHLHIVPLTFDLGSAISCRAGEEITWTVAEKSNTPLDSLPATGEYIAFWSMLDRRPNIGMVRRPVSQWMRRVIAEEMGIGAEWDYQSHPQTDRVQQTLQRLARLSAQASH